MVWFVLTIGGRKMEQILQRLREPSTWAGLSVLGAVFGAAPGLVDAIGQAIAGIAATLAIVLSERKKSEDK
jgi:predicted branched-subunit amino acid permease